MSRSSKRRKKQARQTAIAQLKKNLEKNAPSAIPSPLIAQITREVTTEYSGPFPPPGLLSQYEEILPGSAERIIKMAEMQIAHRVELESIVITGDSSRSWWGLILGFVLSLAVLGVGWSVAQTSPTQGASIIIGTIVSLAGVFVYGSWSRRTEREHKARLMAGRPRREKP